MSYKHCSSSPARQLGWRCSTASRLTSLPLAFTRMAHGLRRSASPLSLCAAASHTRAGSCPLCLLISADRITDRPAESLPPRPKRSRPSVVISCLISRPYFSISSACALPSLAVHAAADACARTELCRRLHFALWLAYQRLCLRRHGQPLLVRAFSLVSAVAQTCAGRSVRAALELGRCARCSKTPRRLVYSRCASFGPHLEFAQAEATP